MKNKLAPLDVSKYIGKYMAKKSGNPFSVKTVYEFGKASEEKYAPPCFLVNLSTFQYCSRRKCYFLRFEKNKLFYLSEKQLSADFLTIISKEKAKSLNLLWEEIQKEKFKNVKGQPEKENNCLLIPYISKLHYYRKSLRMPLYKGELVKYSNGKTFIKFQKI